MFPRKQTNPHSKERLNGLTFTYDFMKIKMWSQQQQQQQQQSLLSQASWGRLEMKPKRHKGQGSGTLIASLQALLSKANSSEIS